MGIFGENCAGYKQRENYLQAALQRIDAVEKKFDKQIESIESRQADLESKSTTKDDLQKLAGKMKAELMEEKERCLRKDNIVIFGISEDDEGDKLYDKLMGIIGDHIESQLHKERIGKPENNNRTLRVHLPPGSRRKLFLKRKLLKDKPEFDKVSVCPDLTKLQQEERKVTRSQTAEERNAAATGKETEKEPESSTSQGGNPQKRRKTAPKTGMGVPEASKDPAEKSNFDGKEASMDTD